MLPDIGSSIAKWLQQMSKEKPRFNEARKKVGKVNAGKLSTHCRKMACRRSSRRKNINHRY